MILGCGRVGSGLAANLSANHHVSVVDWNQSAFERLPTGFSGDTVLGNGIDADILRAAGVENAALFLALTDLDNRNLMAAQVARELGARRVVARVYEPIRAEVFQTMGVTTVCPTVNAAQKLFEMVTSGPEGA
ncbi:MAG: potassium channel family protein [Chloroflexota bacterium]